MNQTFILMAREEDALKAGMPTLQFVDADNYDRWLRITGPDLLHREAESPLKRMQAGPLKRYRIIIEEIP